MKRSLWAASAASTLLVVALAAGCSRNKPVAEAPAPAASGAEIAAPQPTPIGKERRGKDWDADVEALLFSRRTTASDLVGGTGGIAFNPADCRRCHENAQGVEGQVFYGPEFKDFRKNQWAEMLSRPEKGEVPVRDYDFIAQHQKRATLVYDVFPEAQIRQNP